MRKRYDEMTQLGDMFRRAREKKGVTIEQAAESTRVREHYLEALEKSDYSSLPAPVYTKGFIKNYAKYLGINPSSALAFYRREHQDSIKGEEIKSIEQKKNSFNLDFFMSQRGVFILTSIFIISLFIIYILTRVGDVVSPPTFEITSPVPVSAGSQQTYSTEEDSITIQGNLEVGSTLKLNGSVVDTKNLEIFEIPDLRLEEGENTYNFTATSEFGIDTEIVLVVEKRSGANETTTVDEEDNPEPEEEFEEMFIEIIIGPREANLKVTVDGSEKQNFVEEPDTVKTYKATSSVIIETPRPDSVRVAINGIEKNVDSTDPIEWNLIEGEVIRRR